jgi:indole-3-glycerol phosphate synthase
MGILQDILRAKQQEVDSLKRNADTTGMREKALAANGVRDLVGALRNCPHIPVIAEIKRSSPSEGALRSVDDPAGFAEMYERSGAAALSVLTDESYFGGCIRDLEEARGAVSIPVLRKDFIIDPIQIYEARLAGADAVLLIAAALDEDLLYRLYTEIIALEMSPVVEVHNSQELTRALRLDPRIIGINNRNLSTLEVDITTCRDLRPLIQNGALVLAESGIGSADDIRVLREHGLDAFLIGTTLMRSPDPGATLRTLCGSES